MSVNDYTDAGVDYPRVLTSTGGYTCEACGLWIDGGGPHHCRTSLWPIPGSSPELSRIAAALERIADALEKIGGRA